MNFEVVHIADVNLQTRSCQYGKPLASSATEFQTKVSTESSLTHDAPSQIPQPWEKVLPKIPKGPLRRTTNSAKAAHNYNIIDDLAQSPAVMSTLEVLQSCPSQRKALLFALGIVDPSDDHLIVFDVDKSEHPPLPSSITFQIPVKIYNAHVLWCIIDEGTSTCVMSVSIWNKLESPNLSPSTITLRAWDSHSSHPLGMYRNCLVTLVGKTFCIDIANSDGKMGIMYSKCEL